MRRTCALLWLAELALACSPKATQYRLRVDPKDARNNQLCEATEESKPPLVDAPDTNCRVFAGQALKAPGTLTVTLAGATDASRYDLRVRQFTTEATAEAKRSVFSEFLTRFTSILVQKVDSEGAKKILETVATTLTSSLTPGVAPDEADGTAAPAETITPEDLFADFLAADRKHLRKMSELVSGELRKTNTPAERSYPPPRAVTWDDATLAYILGLVDAAEVSAHLRDWCSPASFNTKTYTWTKWFAETKPDERAVVAALQPDPYDIASYLLERSTEPRFNADRAILQESADGAAFAPATPAAKTVYLMNWATSIGSDLINCRNNATLLAPKLGAGQRGDLEAVVKQIDELRAQLDPFIKANGLFRPVFQAGAAIAEQTLQLRGASFGTMTLEPGKLELGIGHKQEEERKEVATLSVDVQGVERFFVGVGPVFSYWPDTFEAIEEQGQPAAGEMPASRQLVRETASSDLNLAAILHITLLADHTFGLGALLGYPLTKPRGSSDNVLIGAGLRIESRIELGIGAHLFRVRRGTKTFPVDLTVMGNEAVGPEDVSDERVGGALFLFLGVAQGLF